MSALIDNIATAPPKITQATPMLGMPTKDFDPSKLQSMMYLAKTVEDIKAVKEYVLSYFARTDDPVATWMWRPSDHIFKIYNDEDVKKCHIYKDVTQIRLDEERFSKFNIQDWFF